MEVVLKIKKQDSQKVKDILLKDETISKASITFKESKGIGLEGDNYYCYITGSNEVCDKARNLTKGLAEIANKKETGEIIKKIKSEEESAMSGFGNIFG